MGKSSIFQTQGSLLLLTCFLAVVSAFFFPTINVPGKSMMNVCIYSADPSRYQPKCFLCPSSSYSNVLRACVTPDTIAIPSNITYLQASCIERNCAVGRGRRNVQVLEDAEARELFASSYEEDYDE